VAFEKEEKRVSKKINENLFCRSGGSDREEILWKRECSRLFSFFSLLYGFDGMKKFEQRVKYTLEEKEVTGGKERLARR